MTLKETLQKKNEIDHEIGELIDKMGHQGYNVVLFGISGIVVRKILGAESKHWQNHIAHLKGTQSDGRLEHKSIRMAHMLYGLLSIPGFLEKITETRGGELGIDDFLWELNVAYHLTMLGYRIQFRKPTGEKGNDYDFDLWTGKNEKYEVEVKNRDKEINDERALRNALNHARSQLPKGGRGVIYISVPALWFTDQALVSRIDQIVADLFRNTTRVKHVIMQYVEVLKVDKSHASAAKTYSFKHPNEPTKAFLLSQLDVPAVNVFSFSTKELEDLRLRTK